MINYHLLVAGRVQGVGFRWATLEIANELGLVGWVKNRADGQVEIVVQGQHAAVRTFLKESKLAPTAGPKSTGCKLSKKTSPTSPISAFEKGSSGIRAFFRVRLFL